MKESRDGEITFKVIFCKFESIYVIIFCKFDSIDVEI